jgi:hypothetical protein
MSMHANPLGRSAQRSSLCKILFATVLLAGLFCISATTIADTVRYPDFQQPFDFTLSLSNSDIELQGGNGQTLVSEDRISISVLTRIEPHLQLGFITGSSDLFLDNDAPTAGMSLNGYHAGLLLRSEFGDNPRITAHGNYLYQQSNNERTGQTTSLSWQQWAAGISGTVILGQRLELSAGWMYHDVDARRRTTGVINETKRLVLASGSQGRFAIAWHVRSGGRVGLVLQRGSYQQVEFRFSREFR